MESLRKYALSVIMLSLLIGGSIYYFWIHRYPFTQNAFVTANIRTVTAWVGGYIEKIHVGNNVYVKKGTPLLTIYQVPYQLKVEQLGHSIAAQKANILNLQSQIKGAEAAVKQKEFILANAQYLSAQAVTLYKGASVSQQYAEERVRASQESEAVLRQSQQLLNAARYQEIQAQAQCKNLEKQLAAAKIDLEQTVVRAQADGYVVNMHLSPGAYATPGTALFAFVDNNEWFIQANFQETELSEIRTGLPARIWLWQYPGIELQGVVKKIGWAVERRLTDTGTGMPSVEKENDWFLLPQRYPVQIKITQKPPDLQLHPGGSAFVQIPVSAHPIRQFFWRLFQL